MFCIGKVLAQTKVPNRQKRNSAIQLQIRFIPDVLDGHRFNECMSGLFCQPKRCCLLHPLLWKGGFPNVLIALWEKIFPYSSHTLTAQEIYEDHF
jgi:hypothetical protein